MSSRTLLSGWVGGGVTILALICVAAAVHDDRPALRAEQTAAYSSMSLQVAWLVAKGSLIWQARRRPLDDDPRDSPT